MNYRLSVLFIFIFTLYLRSQSANILLDNYYKNEYLRFSKNHSISSFYPINETQFALNDSIKDKTVFYYDLPVWFFQKHWIEVNKEQFYLHISPLINFSFGKSTDPKDFKPLYRNSRGLFAEGQVGKKINFQFYLSENQSSFCNYEANYFRDRGELYTSDFFYIRQNAIIPSGARTKDFKKNIYPNAFDYAFSIGTLSYQINKKLRLEIGNNQHFIGNGYRSLFLSDNTIGSPYLRILKSFGTKWEYQFLTKKHLNLIRKPSSYGLETPYENKWFLLHYLTYKVNKSFSLSFISAGTHLRGDSLVKHNINPLFIIPTGNSDLWNDSKIINGINGINLDYAFNKIKIYSQIATDKYDKKQLFAYQIGASFFDLFKIKNIDLQLEYNYIPNNFYSDYNFKLSYSNGNLPLAHPKGNNFNELFLKLSYSVKRFQFLCSQSIYLSKGGDNQTQIIQNSIFYNSEIKKIVYSIDDITYIFNGEIIYRFNKRYNAQLYFQFKSRISNSSLNNIQVNSYLFGLRTSLFNQYLDF